MWPDRNKKSPVLIWLKNSQWPEGNQCCGNMVSQENWPRMRLLSEVKDREFRQWQNCLFPGLERKVSTEKQAKKASKPGGFILSRSRNTKEKQPCNDSNSLQHSGACQTPQPWNKNTGFSTHSVRAGGWEQLVSCMENRRKEQTSKSKTKCIRNASRKEWY